MKNCPIHFYWGRKNGLIVTRETEDFEKPEILYADNRLSLEKLKKIAAAALLVLLVIWRITRKVNRVRRLRSRHSR